MFSVRIANQAGESKEFPLMIFESEIYTGDGWVPCPSFSVPQAANDHFHQRYLDDTIVYAFHEGQVTKDSFECWNKDEEIVGYIFWELLIDGKPCTHEEMHTEMMKKLHSVYRIPRKLDHKYRGCGNGIAVIDKRWDEIVDFFYTDTSLNPIEEQNIAMCDDAGKMIREDDKTITYRANFSSYQIYLY